jgi:hypothetical protein
MLCGYPQKYSVHDVNEDRYDSESPTGRELYECDGVDEGNYVSEEDEMRILRQLKRCVEKQFVDIAWVESAPPLRVKLAVLNKIERAIRGLK